MYKEPKPIKEIHEIREKLYEENKNLSHQQHIAKVHKEAQEVIKKYGLSSKKLSHAN